ncbi:MAG: hypothetical protein R3C13_10175 [Hyphomonas sp.]|uniref:hypothetical protein n=1 Tax=Hyphomonas sp. TaxID=87 RepID=UPI003528EFFF
MTKVWKATALAAVLMGFGTAAIAQEETEVTTEMTQEEADALAQELEAAADTPEVAADETAAPVGQWTRKNGDTVDVSLNGNELFCTITAGKKVGFEMCHGMTLREDGTWKGKKMKHPGMPGFMTFNGTIKVDGDALSIKGCAAGVCDSEDWTKVAG